MQARHPIERRAQAFGFRRAGAKTKEPSVSGWPSGHIRFGDTTMEYWLPDAADSGQPPWAPNASTTGETET